MIETGNITPWGTRAFISASKASNDNPFNNYGKVDKQQYNAKIYQPIGTRRRLHLHRRPLQPEPQQLLRLARRSART